jgi:hypothetical protein
MACVIPLSPMSATTTETKLMQMTNINSRTETLKFLNIERSFNDLWGHFSARLGVIDEFDKYRTI